jgi:glyoxylase-like metal-dependent hydrolase (beta-lactamase superfamily II)
MSGIEVDVLVEGTRIDTVSGGTKVSSNICSAVVLIRAGGRTLVVDPGAMGFADKVVERLARLGMRPGDIDTVVNTHSHLDHTYNNYLFPKADIYTLSSVWRMGRVNSVEMLPGLADLGIPGITTLATPGHMDKHMSLLVETGGKKMVIAGDAVHEYLIEAGRAPMSYADPAKYLESERRIFELADEIIPGHGPTIKGQRLKELREKLAKIEA